MFDRPSGILQVGDVVEWAWESPVGISDVLYTVQQTDDIESLTATEYGFRSRDEPNTRGGFSYKFTEEGVFYYWSGPVNPSGKICSLNIISVSNYYPIVILDPH